MTEEDPGIRRGLGSASRPHPFLRRVGGLWLALGTGDEWAGQSLQDVASVLETQAEKSA